MVSCVVKVFDATINRVVSGLADEVSKRSAYESGNTTVSTMRSVLQVLRDFRNVGAIDVTNEMSAQALS